MGPPSPKIILTASPPDFDPTTLQHLRDEGYEVSYLPCTSPLSEYETALDGLADPLDTGESYAIVAFGAAASIVLGACQKAMPKLSALVCYYPSTLPSPSTVFPPRLRVLVHIAGTQEIGAPLYKSYVYSESEVGFAGVDFETYDPVAAGLAWSRTLGVLRRAFGVEVDLEGVWETHTELEFATKDVEATMATMVAEPYVNHVPTCTGGVGYEDLHRFYRDYFIPGNPPSLKMRLVSRTVGTDRVVDELFVSFRHTHVLPWMLPEIAPTDKEVEVALVAIVCIRGGKLYHEHIYWDQATVLVQIGLLDPNLVPGKENRRLPVVDGASARKVLDEKSVKSNELIDSW